MGMKAERKHILNYKFVYDNTKITNGKSSFRLKGKIEEWGHIEILSRIFYKKLERLLYGNEITDIMYESSIKKVLDENDLLEDTFFNVIKKKEYQFEALNTMLIKIFDFVYFNVKKKLPYTKELSLIANAISELLENTFKYTNRDFSLTAGFFSGEYPLIIKLENNYADRNSKETTDQIEKLQAGIKEINQFEDPDEAYLEVMKNRIETGEENLNGEKESSRLGFAKMRADTKANITFSPTSKLYGESGITITLSIPIEISSADEMLKIIRTSL
ncbi:MAG: hypothetical protein A2015_00210 [Spirochaetes bacterium GWF1_31_7]|nr:MAG: hypothetical protein A2Y30_04300 [Spirochaetes bacterium GWE1_32_154]OHD45595.1 MAG: hypothetical protein A2Y29_10405 [Spirochaetes bacterium GWE2_31_10]OHD51013.1 MAG: hypothetical protein A2015_00210 [Spirochaetes bacterium GWF1_31_7]OHD83265.1 MAG: hypothetical protein A2355_15410 [Spirochaetes bacterium RIFOXYB1_FULL_32_8]HBD94328.1 hypothetical protein [Spirochaetia bacterium]